jgi:hypothetical protein
MHGHTHTLEFYLTTRKKETRWFEGKLTQMEDIMLREARFRKKKATFV